MEVYFSQILFTFAFIAKCNLQSLTHSWFRCSAGFSYQSGEGSEAIKACCCLGAGGRGGNGYGWLQTTCPLALEAAA